MSSLLFAISSSSLGRVRKIPVKLYAFNANCQMYSCSLDMDFPKISFDGLMKKVWKLSTSVTLWVKLSKKYRCPIV